MRTERVSWVCARIVDAAGKTVSGGCGGNWGSELPTRCKGCGGVVRQTDRLTVIDL